MVSELTLGTAQLGMAYGIANRVGALNGGRAMELVLDALRVGITTFDTAPDYGCSEERLGLGLRASGLCEGVHVASKLALPAQRFSSVEDLREWVKRSVGQSLIRLGVRRLSFLLVHRYTDLISGGKELVRVLGEMVDSGYVACTGVSLYHPEELAVALRNPAVQAVQIPVNALDQRWRRHGWLDRCGEVGVAVFARSVFLQGLLLLEPEDAERKVPGSRPWVERLHGIARVGGMSVRELALRYVLSLGGISSIVIGGETPEQILENVASLEAAGALDGSLMRELETAFSDVPVELTCPVMWPRDNAKRA